MMETQQDRFQSLRKRLLSWHYQKSATIAIVDLLDANFQNWRRKVEHRTDKGKIDFREAIKVATMDELQCLDIIILEDREDKKRGK